MGNQGSNSRMTVESTSPVPGENRANAPAQSARGEWSNFLAFLRRPALTDTIAPAGESATGMVRMLALDLMIMTIIIGVLMTIVALGIELPENLNATLELDLGTIALIVIAAPVLEELAFRSWLSGKPGYLLAIAVLILAGIVGAVIAASADGEAAQAAIGLSMIVGLILALVALFALRRRAPVGWFRALFPGMFWLSAVGFGLIHLLNYPEEGVFWIALPLVIPQFVLGTILGYVRVRYGLWTAMVIHAAHNGFALSVAAIAMEIGAT